MDSPLNLAHQQGRRADMMLKAGKFEESIVCHNRAAEYLLDAMQQTRFKPALESLQLQHAHHLKQTSQLYDRQRRAQILQIKQTKSQLCHQTVQTNISGPITTGSIDQASSPTFQTSPRPDNNLTFSEMTNSAMDPISPLDQDSIYRTLTANDSLIGLLLRRRQNMDGENNLKSFHSGVPIERMFNSKPTASPNIGDSDTQESEELRIHNEDLRKHVQQLLKEVEELKRENKGLKERMDGTQTIFRDVGGSELELIPDLPPLEMPQFDFDLLEQDSGKLEEDTDSILGKSLLSPL